MYSPVFTDKPLNICTQLRLSSKNRLVPLRTSSFMIRSMINSWEQAANRKYAMNEHQSRTHQVYYFISQIRTWLWNVTVIYTVIHKLNQLLQGNTLEYCVNFPHEITSKLKSIASRQHTGILREFSTRNHIKIERKTFISQLFNTITSFFFQFWCGFVWKVHAIFQSVAVGQEQYSRNYHMYERYNEYSKYKH